MLIPLGHEKTSVRRLPWMTFGILGVCLVAHIVITISWHGEGQRLVENLDTALQYFFEHPYLELDEDFKGVIAQNIPPEEVDALLAAARQMGPQPPDSAAQIREYQQTLDRLTSTALEALQSTPFHDWGLVPAKLLPHSVVTHMFVHGGWLHLIGNLFILFLAGPFIEDVWGRPLFLSFYLVGGAFAGLMYAVRYPDLAGPLIGASGAVAAVMGAFLVRFFNAKIKFFYWFFIFFGTFSAPAWLMLPLWFARELFFAQALDVVIPGGGGGGVAYWAHVWGFAFGAVVAGGIRRFDVEERFIDRAIESKITVVDNRSIEEALDLRSEGREDEAFELLTRAVAQDPGNVDAVTALWHLAVDLHRTELVAPRLLHLLRKAAMSGDEDLVVAQWGELGRELPELRLEPGLALRIAEVFHAAGDDATAGDVISRLTLAPDTEIPPGGAVRLARLAASLGSGNASALAAIALSHPDLPEDARLELASIAETEDPAPASEDEASVVPDEAPSEGPVEVVGMPRRELRVMHLKPTSLAATGLVLHAGQSRRTLAFEHIQAIAVGGINAAAGKAAHLVVDLLLDPPYGSQEELRIVRLDGTAYDPRQIVDESDSMTAFRKMIGRLLDASEALPLPDADAARGQPFRMYGSLADYEKSVLNAS